MRFLSVVKNRILSIVENQLMVKMNLSGDLFRKKIDNLCAVENANNAKSMDAFMCWIKKAKLDIKPHQVDGMRWLLDRDGLMRVRMNSDNLFTQYQFLGQTKDLVQSWGIEPGQRTGGGILADEMGLGKTILMLGLIISNFQQRTLIVVPPTILVQWETEIRRLLGHNPLIYHGRHKRHISLEQLKAAPIVLTTYGMLYPHKRKGILMPSLLTEISWKRAIYDEAHHLRNPKTRKHRGALNIRSNITWLVSGTPIQNRIRDFCSLCTILKKSVVRKKDTSYY